MSDRLKYWLPAIFVAILISVFSTHSFNYQQTAGVIIPILRWLFPLASPRALYLMHVAIRKLAHITEFGAFSIAVFHGVRGNRSGWRFEWALSTLLIAFAYGALDEWHQSFVPMREPRVRDVVIDATGAALAQVLVWAYAKWRRDSSDFEGAPQTAAEP